MNIRNGHLNMVRGKSKSRTNTNQTFSKGKAFPGYDDLFIGSMPIMECMAQKITR